MTDEITPKDFQLAAKRGMQRIQSYRRMRAKFVQQAVGQYYREHAGYESKEPVNLLYNAIRVLLPNYVMKNPKCEIESPYPEHDFYAELLGLGVDQVNKSIGFMWAIREWIVDALFGFGILRTGIASSDNLISIDDVDIDPGQVFSDRVDLDNFFFDPACIKFDKASFLGDVIQVPRQYLLDHDIYNSDLVKRLPSVSERIRDTQEVKEITKHHFYGREIQSLQDIVSIGMAYIPGSNRLVTMPDPRGEAKFDDFLSEEDFFGPKEGPYTFLSFTFPVPNNPFPVAPLGIVYDLHKSANDVFNKIVDQSMAQKDILLYKPQYAETAETVRDADNLEMVASDDPKGGINALSLGGQNPVNERMLGLLEGWFSMMAGNVELLGGAGGGETDTATEAQILQSNASIGVEDGREILYHRVAEVCYKEAWYLDNDPFIDLPLIKRDDANRKVTVRLTPEQRSGDFLNFVFTIGARSMSKLDPRIRAQRVEQMLTRVIPSVAMAAQTMMQFGVPFNVSKTIMKYAEELDIADWINEIFEDPDYAQKLEIMASLGPKGQNMKNPKGNLSPAGVMQNGGAPVMGALPTPTQDNNMFAQDTAGEAQSLNQGVV